MKRSFDINTIIHKKISFTLNGTEIELSIEPHQTLQEVLRLILGKTGTKHMCGRGACGSCTVILDDSPILSCQTLAVECDNVQIETIEGIAQNPDWKPLIDAYCKWDAMQCGYCTPGFIVTAKHLLDKNSNPSEQECLEALAGNICICGTYPRHAQAILEAARDIKKREEENG